MKHIVALMCLSIEALPIQAAPEGMLLPANTPSGYLTRLLINEAPFPGERGYVSEEDSKATLRALLLVIDARRNRIPPGYTREEVAATSSTNIIDVITAGGDSNQMDGFYRDTAGRPAMAPRVKARVARLQRIASQGEPDRFARLLAYAQTLSNDYLEGKPPSPDLFASITHIPPRTVTGHAYAWMTDQEYYHPGGDFIRIPNRLRGRLGGNRFYTLEKRKVPAAQPAAPGAPLVTVPQ